MFINTIGWLAAVCFAASGVPFAVSVARAGKTAMSLSGVLLILGGSVGMFTFTAGTSHALPLLADFTLNTVCWAIVLKYRLFPRTKD